MSNCYYNYHIDSGTIEDAKRKCVYIKYHISGIREEGKTYRIDNVYIHFPVIDGVQIEPVKLPSFYAENIYWGETQRYQVGVCSDVKTRGVIERDVYVIPSSPDGVNYIFNAIFRSYRWREADIRYGEKVRYGQKRPILSQDLCPYLHIPTDTKLKCYYSGEEMSAPHSLATKMGAPRRCAPYRMQQILTPKGKQYAIWEREIRKNCYFCESLGVYVDKECVAHKQGKKHPKCLGYCLSKRAVAKLGIAICGRCGKNAITKERKHKVKKQYLCDDCRRKMSMWDSRGISYTPIVKKNGVRTYGIEFEFNDIVARGEMKKDIVALNIDGVKFGVWGDGSVHNGYEVVSQPSDRRTITKATRALCAVVNGYPHTYNASGIHVHVQDKNIAAEQVFKVWLILEKFAYSMLPRERRDETHVRLFCEESFRKILDVTKNLTEALKYQRHIDDKYTSMNLTPMMQGEARINWDSFWCNRCGTGEPEECQCGYVAEYEEENTRPNTGGTVEVRAHHATADARAIVHWLKFIDAIWDLAKTATDRDCKKLYTFCKKPIGHSDKICKMLKLNKGTVKFIQEKQRLYSMPYEERIPLLNKWERIYYHITNEDAQARELSIQQAHDEAAAINEESSMEIDDEDPTPSRLRVGNQESAFRFTEANGYILTVEETREWNNPVADFTAENPIPEIF